NCAVGRYLPRNPRGQTGRKVVNQHMTSPRVTHRRQAFTLIELLVVIAIITILLAILIPSLSMARRISQQTKCGANLKDIATAWAMYLQDNETRFPQWVDVNINYGGRQGSTPQYRGGKPLNPYVGQTAPETDSAPVFRCPSDSGTPQAAPTCYE